jgi:hypothetical protein
VNELQLFVERHFADEGVGAPMRDRRFECAQHR